jgi:DNA polymerase-3 subunit delta'
MILGHSKIISYLKKISGDKKNIAHAFLFSGPEGVGKRTVALEFAASLICQKKDPPFGGCKECDACSARLNGTNPDLIYIDPKEIAEKTGKSENIPIEVIRDLKKNLGLNPYNENSLKVAVINDVHKMEKEGFNAILKTLEEPPSKSAIIMVTSLPESLPKTILSRVQTVKFSRQTKKEIKEYLASNKMEAGEDEVNFFSEDPSLLFGKEADVVKKHNKHAKDFYLFLEMPLEEKYEHVEDLLKKEEELDDIVNGWIVALRSMLIQKISQNEAGNSVSSAQKTVQGSFEAAEMISFIKAAMELNFLLRTTNVNKKIAMDTFILIFDNNKK